jgi:hypothetical protein
MTDGIPADADADARGLRERLDRALGAGRVRPDFAEAAAAAVAADRAGRALSRAAGRDRPGALSLAVCLCALGEPAAAGRLLEVEGLMEYECAARFCRAVTESGGGTLRRGLLREGWLSPRVDPAAPASPAWRLDIGGLVEGLRIGTELEGFQFLDRLARELAPLWSESEGRGRLFLKGVRRAAAVWGGRPAQRRRLRTDVPVRLAQRLTRLAAMHAWRRTPEVVREDLGA